MPLYRVMFDTTISVGVVLEADNEDDAADAAWRPAEDYLQTLNRQFHGGAMVLAFSTLDGVGADDAEVELVKPA